MKGLAATCRNEREFSRKKQTWKSRFVSPQDWDVDLAGEGAAADPWKTLKFTEVPQGGTVKQKTARWSARETRWEWALTWVNTHESPWLHCQRDCPLECWYSLKSPLLRCLQNSLRRCWLKCQKNLLENVYHLVCHMKVHMKVPASHCTVEARRKATEPGMHAELL